MREISGWPLSIAYSLTSLPSRSSPPAGRRRSDQARTHSSVSGVGASAALPPAASTNPSQSATWSRSSTACRRSSGRSGAASAAASRDRGDRLAPRAGTGPSSAPAPRGSALRPTSAGRRGGGARSSARGLLDPLPDPLRHAILLVHAGGEARRIAGAVRPQAHDIAVPPFPPGTQWIGAEPGAVERICARGPLLVHFFDVAHLSSVRTLPYVRAWEERYRDLGLTVVGVNSPRFPFTADAGKLAAALDAARGPLPRRRRLRLPDLARLRVRGLAVAVPLGRGRGAALVPLRRGRVRGHRGGDPGGAAGASTRTSSCPSPSRRCGPATPPARSSRRPATRSSRAARSPSRGGRARTIRRSSSTTRRAAPGRRSTARGALRASLDGGPRAAIEVEAPGAYELADPRAPRERTTCPSAPRPALSVYSIGFAAGVPWTRGCRGRRISREQPARP